MTHQFDEFGFHPTSSWIVYRGNAARITQAALCLLLYNRNPDFTVIIRIIHISFAICLNIHFIGGLVARCREKLRDNLVPYILDRIWHCTLALEHCPGTCRYGIPAKSLRYCSVLCICCSNRIVKGFSILREIAIANAENERSVGRYIYRSLCAAIITVTGELAAQPIISELTLLSRW